MWGPDGAAAHEERVLAAFGLKSCGGRKYRAFTLGAADGRVFGVRPAFSDIPAARAQIALAHAVKERLHDCGFGRVDRFRRSADGDPFVSWGGFLYVAERKFDINETDFGDAAAFLRAAEAAAAMHVVFVKAPLPAGGFVPFQYNTESRFAAARDAFGQVVKRARSGRRLSDFDVCVLKNREFYAGQLDEWREAAGRCDLDGMTRLAAESGFIAHNALREESVLSDAAGVAIIDFLACSRGLFLSDLSSMIGRHFRASRSPAPAAKIVETYNRRNPLTKRDTECLYALLKYPGKFLSVCESFYEKKRSFTPAAFLTRIEKVTAAQNAYAEYINEINHF